MMFLKYCFLTVIFVPALTCQIISEKFSLPPRAPLIDVYYSSFDHPSNTDLIYEVVEFDETPIPFEITCAPSGPYDDVFSYYYYWEKDGQNFHWSRARNITNYGGKLTFHVPHNEDAGVYRCHALNQYGLATSEEVHVKKSTFDDFGDMTSKTITVGAGDYVKLTCNAPQANPKAIISWHSFKNGVIRNVNSKFAQADSNDDLWIRNIPAVNSNGTVDTAYVCKASVVVEKETPWRGAKLKSKIGPINYLVLKESVGELIVTKPQIIFASKNRFMEVGHGGDVKLFCICSGNPTPEFKWFKDGVEIDDEIENSLFVPMSWYSDYGRYTCKASNSAGTVEHHIDLLPVDSIIFDFSLQTLIAEVGETKTVKCQRRSKHKVEWFFNGRPIAEAPPNERRMINGTEITIVDVKTSDAYGVYGCKISNELGHRYKEISLIVISQPLLQSVPKSKSFAMIGSSNFTIGCSVLGASKPHWRWFFNGIEINDANRVKVLDTGELLIKEVKPEDDGRLMCQASNIYGSNSYQFNFKVIKPVEILKSSEYIIAKNSLEIECPFKYDAYLNDVGEPPQVAWFKDGEMISELTVRENSAFHKEKVVEEDVGIYQCQVKTKFAVVEGLPVIVMVEK